ncbi:hypothetical protein HQ585_16650 [candidate division KSB1 bacterium]|nr:hypothetical protein [candidate division KSB1 bacterium]
MSRNLLFSNLLILFISQSSLLFPQTIGFRGQLSGWAGVSNPEDWNATAGSRYVPELSGQWKSVDFETSVNGYWTQNRINGDWLEADSETKPYRMWVRFSQNQWEIRAGLQKINFGSAAMLRPLMWFDRIDPRDPLQMTDGVWGVLGRYYFQSNANIWLWGLLGNDDPKGWEVFGSDKNIPEFGGRIQVPTSQGEVAFTLHHRESSLMNSHLINLYTGIRCPISCLPPNIENRFALDGKWDIGPGIWFEGAYINQDFPFEYYLSNQHMLTIGMDYTLGLGNGLHAMVEHLYIEFSEEAFSKGQCARFTASSISYPIGLLDQISAMFYYDWDNEELYRFINIQRMYDRWSLYLMAFWNPDTFNLPQMNQAHTFFAGKGIQFMIVFNH